MSGQAPADGSDESHTQAADAAHRAAQLFRSTFGRAPQGVWSSPGRVNLIGEHTDYNQGLVLPFAIDARATLAVARTDEPTIRLVSALHPDVVATIATDDVRPDRAARQGWAAYLVGVLWVLAADREITGGWQMALHSDVPTGAGLSSSAALECATAKAICDLLDWHPSVQDIARTAQRAENDYVGMPCGLMDQMASAACVQQHVLYFDVGAEQLEQVPFSPDSAAMTVLIIDTQVKHALVDGEYARRRASCEEAARILGLTSLRELDISDLDAALARLDTDELRRRTRHVVTENERVKDTVALLRSGRLDRGVGELLTASHASLRDDYEVSDPALDLAVDSALAAGAIGARMTGGGFGGSAIALVPIVLADSVTEAVAAAFERAGRRRPVVRVAVPSAGVRRDL